VFAQIVLILAHTDRSGINLDQFGERVLKPPGDGDRSAQGHIWPEGITDPPERPAQLRWLASG
jgi:hypothetical protein